MSNTKFKSYLNMNLIDFNSFFCSKAAKKEEKKKLIKINRKIRLKKRIL